MKCDNCKFMCCDFGVPYLDVSCVKGHWDGIDFLGEEDVDPWIDCLDFKDSIEHTQKGDRDE